MLDARLDLDKNLRLFSHELSPCGGDSMSIVSYCNLQYMAYERAPAILFSLFTKIEEPFCKLTAQGEKVGKISCQ
jgi:hypothetical protein